MNAYLFFIALFLKFIAWIFSKTFRLLHFVLMKLRMHSYISKLRAENIRKRLVFVDHDILYSGRQAVLSPGNHAMMLYGETDIASVKPFVRSGKFSSTIISGGKDNIRALSFLRACEEADSCGLPMIILHASNNEIARLISGSSISGKKYIVYSGASGYVYDPLQGLPASEAARIFVESSGSEAVRKNNNYFILAELIAEIYSLKSGGKRAIPLPSLINSNPSTILSDIREAKRRGVIDDIRENSMKQRYASAQKDLNNFGGLLRNVSTRTRDFYPSGASQALNTESILRDGGTIIIDMKDTRNTELFRMMAENFQGLHRNGVRFVACFYDINIRDYDGAFIPYISQTGADFIISSNDIVTDASYPPPSCLDKIMSSSERCIYFRHSGSSSAIISQALGQYERWDISYRWGAGYGRIIPEYHAGIGAAMKSEARLHSSIIQSLRDSQMILHESSTNQIYITSLK